jgi:hypothetical protein
MKPRGGRRIGTDLVTGAFGEIPDESRRKILDGLTPELVKHIEAERPGKNPDGSWPPDPSIPYKDAAFAMLSHEPPLVSDEGHRSKLSSAVMKWTQTDFENRIESPAQQFAIEVMLRFFGPPAVRGLPNLLTEESTRIDRVAGLIAEIGDPETKKKGAEALVALAKKTESAEWFSKNTAVVEEANKRAKAVVTPDQLKVQVAKYQDGELQKVFVAMKRLGGKPVVDYCISYASDKAKPEERRKLALAALEGRVDKNQATDVDRLYAIAAAEDTSDNLRDLAFARLGELPKEVLSSKLYPLFESRKWKIRWAAGSLVVKTLTPRQIPEFLKHLPASPSTKMAMTEPITFGTLMAQMQPPPGEPKPVEVITPFLSSSHFGSKLTALAFYYGGKKAETALLRPFEDDKAPVPKCDDADECGWQCSIPKGKDVENKAISTVGDFVKYCVIPSMETP